MCPHSERMGPVFSNALISRHSWREGRVAVSIETQRRAGLSRAHGVRPQFVAEVKYLTWTGDMPFRGWCHRFKPCGATNLSDWTTTIFGARRTRRRPKKTGNYSTVHQKPCTTVNGRGKSVERSCYVPWLGTRHPTRHFAVAASSRSAPIGADQDREGRKATPLALPAAPGRVRGRDRDLQTGLRPGSRARARVL